VSDDLKLPAGLPDELRERIGGLQSHWCWPTLAEVLGRLRVEQERTALLQAECRAWRKVAVVGRAAVSGRPVTGMLTLENEANVDAVVAARSATDEAGALGDG